MLKPWISPQEFHIDLPDVITDSLGSGAEVLVSYLSQLAESGGENLDNYPPPSAVLCRICERKIPPWWFEKHTDLCLQEHRAEMDVQLSQEALTDHRHAIVKVLDALEARKSRPVSGEQQLTPLAEYKGMPIGPPPSTQTSPATSMARSRERSGSAYGHQRARSFAVRRPQARIVELLMDLCDTAMEISAPALKETGHRNDGDFRTQSPQSESRISQVLQWQSPSTNTLEQEKGLAALCADTEKAARAKVDAVFRHRRTIEYAERIRIELAVVVHDCIEEAIREAARVAGNHYSDSEPEDEQQSHIGADPEDVAQDEYNDQYIKELPEEPRGRYAEDLANAANTPSALAAALRQVDLASQSSRATSLVESTRSSSPKECPTPRSHYGGLGSEGAQSRDYRRDGSNLESDTAESESSVRSSSVASRIAARTDSPMSEFSDLRRAASSRQHHRKSLHLPDVSTPYRQESPSRSTQPSSPLRIKPRILPISQDRVISPEASPMLPGSSDFGSPAPPHTSRHHRRQSSAAISDFVMRPPPSPRLNANQPPPQQRSNQPSIKDFEIIKPISKGAFGSVYLSKKKSTGEYFAIKVLKKADMVAKNQVGNVKAERAIMMWQGESEFVAKLYWTFSSKDYLYLVMEYLNGGDCASLIKVLGGLPEDWVKKYLGEVVLGVEHLHERDIIHRDLKPDNLLIDQKGHLKLTDFGLSRMGLIGRQKRALNSENADATPDLLKQGPFVRSTSIASSRSTSMDLHGHPQSPLNTPYFSPEPSSLGQPSYFTLGATSQPQDNRRTSNGRSDSGGSESLTHMLTSLTLSEPPLPGSHVTSQPSNTKSPILGEEEVLSGSPDLPSQPMASKMSMDNQSKGFSQPSNMMPPPMALFDPEDTNRRFVGTPDYLAPETIKGEKQDETSDWWSVGCILFEFLYGIPPFHAGEAEHVFENILARKIMWPPEDPEEPISDEAKDLINKLLCMNPQQRLGANRDEKYLCGGEEIRSHPWFSGLAWDTLLEDDAQFVPEPENIEDTEYFDTRGAILQSFAEEVEDQSSPQSSHTGGSEYPDRPHDALSRVRSQVNSINRKLMPLHIPPHVRDLKPRRLSEPMATDDFGSFSFKNLPVLEKANKDVIQKLRAEALAAQSKQLGSPGSNNPASPVPSLEGSPVLSNPISRTISNAKASARSQSPSSLSHAHSSPSRASQPSSPLLVSHVPGQNNEGRRKASSNSSSLSQSAVGAEVPRMLPSLQKAATTVSVTTTTGATSLSATPAKGRGAPPPPLALSPNKPLATPRQGSGSSNRSRSLTVGSQDGSPVASDVMQHHRNRRSQVFDMSPSSSDNEGDKHNALLRVQRRRQSSRRLSQIAFEGGPTFRPLDVLICEDHPVSRMVIEKLLEKLRCRTISVPNGSEAVRYSMSEIKYDIIFLEYKLPQINGADVARMIRETKNANSHTPIVAITAYLKELQAPHYFDSLIEKPISSSKLTEVLRTLCQWRPQSPGSSLSPKPYPPMPPLRKLTSRPDESPGSSFSNYVARQSSTMMSSREDSITSSVFGDSESVTTDEIPVVLSRKATGDWDEGGGLGINEGDILSVQDGSPRPVPSLNLQHSMSSQYDYTARSFEKLKHNPEMFQRRASESTDSADDEDEDLGLSKDKLSRRGSKHLIGKGGLPSSKLGIEMMRANSHDSAVGSESTSELVTQVATTPAQEMESPVLDCQLDKAVTPPLERLSAERLAIDATPRPLHNTFRQDSVGSSDAYDDDPTPRPVGK